LSTEYTPEETEVRCAKFFSRFRLICYPQINVSVSKANDKDKVREAVKKAGLPKVREKLQEMIDQFKGIFLTQYSNIVI